MIGPAEKLGHPGAEDKILATKTGGQELYYSLRKNEETFVGIFKRHVTNMVNF
jgi:hypothetical protein